MRCQGYAGKLWTAGVENDRSGQTERKNDDGKTDDKTGFDQCSNRKL